MYQISFNFSPKRSYGMGLFVRLSVCGYVAPLLQHVQNYMCEGIKRNRQTQFGSAREASC
jgi:hypothetical protein